MVANEVAFAYTPLWQVGTIVQDADSALSVTGGTSIPSRTLAYEYDTQPVGSGNYSRVEMMLYPGGENYDHLYSTAAWDSTISRLSRLSIASVHDIDYHFVGSSMVAGVDYATPEIQLDRTAGEDGKRSLPGHTSQTAGKYPGWDRFGRVILHSWVDGALDNVSGLLPDRPQIVAERYTYDRSSNRTAKDDIRDGLLWYSQDNDYAYDKLDRLNLASRGRRGGGGTITPANGTIDSSQKWNLNMLGNWAGDPTATPAVPGFIRDFNGDGTLGNTGDLSDVRNHNSANEIEDTSLRGGTSVPFAYDEAGNLQEARLESGGVTRRYVHDAWNRLVKVVNDSATSSDPDDDFVIARYGYNGLHWRVLKHADTRSVQIPEYPVVAGVADLTNRREMMVYDASWRLIHREIEEGYDSDATPAAWDPDTAEELFWGARYIDDAVARRRTTLIDGVEPFNATWGDPEWYLTDAQFSVVALVDFAGLVIERVRYDPYGNAQQMYPGDFNGNGLVNPTDIFDWLAVYNATPPKPLMADFNRDGGVGITDHNTFLGYYFGPGPDVAEGGISSADYAGGGTDNIVGYCGYIHNCETSEYTVRFRHYSPTLGRWLERDPAGFVDGMNLFTYIGSAPIGASDPLGLEPWDPRTDKEKQKAACDALQDAIDNKMTVSEFVKKYGTTFGTNKGVFFQAHVTLDGEDYDVDWIMTLLYVKYHGGEGVAHPVNRILIHSLKGGHIRTIYAFGKTYWIIKDSYDDPDRYITDFFERYGTTEEENAIRVAELATEDDEFLFRFLEQAFECKLKRGRKCEDSGDKDSGDPDSRDPGRDADREKREDDRNKRNEDRNDRSPNRG